MQSSEPSFCTSLPVQKDLCLVLLPRWLVSMISCLQLCFQCQHGNWLQWKLCEHICVFVDMKTMGPGPLQQVLACMLSLWSWAHDILCLWSKDGSGEQWWRGSHILTAYAIDEGKRLPAEDAGGRRPRNLCSWHAVLGSEKFCTASTLQFSGKMLWALTIWLRNATLQLSLYKYRYPFSQVD